MGFLPASCSKPPEEGRKVKFYQSPMHPWITSDKPGNCTICGMALVPVYEGESEIKMEAGIVALNPQSLDVLAVTTVPVRRLELKKSLRFSGTLEDDENIHRIIAAFYDGRVDEIYVEHVGQFVEKGQPLAAIYSPELLYVVREYQNAARSGDPAVARNSAQRLVQYGLSPEQVALLARQPENTLHDQPAGANQRDGADEEGFQGPVHQDRRASLRDGQFGTAVVSRRGLRA